MEVNLRGTLLSTQLVLPEMVGRRRGRIVNLSARARGVPVAACVSVLPRGRYARNDTAADRPRCADRYALSAGRRSFCRGFLCLESELIRQLWRGCGPDRATMVRAPHGAPLIPSRGAPVG
jgi:hypothetical protein